VADIFIACVDGLEGFPEAIEAVYPQTAVQLCVVHMVRHSLNHVSWKMRKTVAADLRPVYNAATADEAALRLVEFEDHWGKDYPTIVKSWQSNWPRIVPVFE
jgi:putative transposase